MISCPACSEEDDLRGERDGERITVTCGACDHRWERDLRARCPTCGGDDLLAVSNAVVEKSRGTQLSVVATTDAHLCRQCDAETIASLQAQPGGRLLMPEELPTESDRD